MFKILIIFAIFWMPSAYSAEADPTIIAKQSNQQQVTTFIIDPDVSSYMNDVFLKFMNGSKLVDDSTARIQAIEDTTQTSSVDDDVITKTVIKFNSIIFFDETHWTVFLNVGKFKSKVESKSKTQSINKVRSLKSVNEDPEINLMDTSSQGVQIIYANKNSIRILYAPQDNAILRHIVKNKTKAIGVSVHNDGSVKFTLDVGECFSLKEVSIKHYCD